jgi:osmotically-inducible protein OsmY
MQSTYKKALRDTAISLCLVGTLSTTACAVKQHQETVGQYVDGGVTTTAIKSKILTDKTLKDTTITVKTYKNMVQLSGFVHTAEQKFEAENIARNVDGVTEVDNALIIKR